MASIIEQVTKDVIGNSWGKKSDILKETQQWNTKVQNATSEKKRLLKERQKIKCLEEEQKNKLAQTGATENP